MTAVPMHYARMQLVLTTAPVCQVSMVMDELVKMLMSAKRGRIIAVDVHRV